MAEYVFRHRPSRLDALRDQADALKAEMEYINNRLGELEDKSKDK
jgi:hypothetical protein